MRKARKRTARAAGLRAEYDFRGGVRGKYATRVRASNIVRLEPDVALVFPDSQAVNRALRELVRLRARHRPARPTKSR